MSQIACPRGCPTRSQRALGHAKASTTLDTYAKLWPSGEDRTRRVASTLARQVLQENVGKMWAEDV